MAVCVDGAQVLVLVARESRGEVVEQAQPDEVEARYGVEVEEVVEDERGEVGAEMGGVVDCVAGDLFVGDFVRGV